MQPTAIDLGPLALALAGFAFAALAGAGTWLAARAAAWLKLSQDSQVRGYLEVALGNGIAFARRQVEARLAAGIKVDVHNATVAEAAEYVIQRVPDALARFGITAEAVRDLIIARLPQGGRAAG